MKRSTHHFVVNRAPRRRIRPGFGCVLVLFSITVASAQSVANKALPAEIAVKKTLLQELNLPAIWFLLACSLLIVWLVVDVFLKSGAKRILPESERNVVRRNFAQGDYQAAYDSCAARPGVFNDAVRAGLRHVGEGKRAVEEAMMMSLSGTNAPFQTKIAYLSVIGVIAPMVGLTGTVLGMIDAFSLMGQAGAADPSKLSGAIGHVLHATAGGLIVAIPAFVFYYALRNRVSHQFHAVSAELAELFRGFPFEALSGHAFRGAEVCAGKPPVKSEVQPLASPLVQS
ncbi:MAG TPA: MotA/TolQ/ExbB proton channel family protein [Opitutaceae bacterium]|nr:MotA/TolQ/ExbB proton channel family protein [Opitutaceae bacterium]